MGDYLSTLAHFKYENHTLLQTKSGFYWKTRNQKCPVNVNISVVLDPNEDHIDIKLYPVRSSFNQYTQEADQYGMIQCDRYQISFGLMWVKVFHVYKIYNPPK